MRRLVSCLKVTENRDSNTWAEGNGFLRLWTSLLFFFKKPIACCQVLVWKRKKNWPRTLVSYTHFWGVVVGWPPVELVAWPEKDMVCAKRMSNCVRSVCQKKNQNTKQFVAWFVILTKLPAPSDTFGGSPSASTVRSYTGTFALCRVQPFNFANAELTLYVT